MTDPLSPDRLAELRRIATGEDWSPPQPEDVAALLGEIDRLTEALGNVQAELGAAQGELIKSFGERDTMQRRAYSAYVRADSIRALADQLRKLTRFMLDGEPRSPGWGTAELLARQVLMAIGPAMPYGASPGTPQRAAAASAQPEPPEAEREPQRPAEGFEARGYPIHYGMPSDPALRDCHRLGEPFTVAMDPGDPAINCPRCRLRLAEDVLKPHEWCDRYNVRILDPDGWRGPDAPDWNERITLHAFRALLGASTSNAVATGGWERVLADVKALDAARIAPEDEGISSADVTAQQAADERNR